MEQNESSIGELAAEIRGFIAACAQPVLLEPGEAPIPIADNSHALEHKNGRLTIEVWDERHNLLRRVTGIRSRRPGRLELDIRRLGNKRGKLLLLDQRRPSAEAVCRQGGRRRFREQFRRFLSRQFPGWRIARITTEPDLEHTLSPLYPRALLHRGVGAWAAIGAPADASLSDTALAFGLIWLDYLRTREPRRAVEGLILFLPAGSQHTTCLRLRLLDRKAAAFRVYVYTPDGSESLIDPEDFGNLDTRLARCDSPSEQEAPPFAATLGAISGLQRVAVSGGELSYRFNGLEIGRWRRGRLSVGIDRKRLVSGGDLTELLGLAAQLERLRSPAARDRASPFFSRAPESWIESQVRQSIHLLDADLLPEPLYGQVPAVVGGDRGILDLLAVNREGRLTVLELKATPDPQLPLQALDYWVRVRYHSSRGEFSPKGYFPGIPLSHAAPRLLLVAPALEFHSTTEVLLRYFDPVVPVERIGLGSDWRQRLRVVFRLSGAVKPGM